MSDVSCANCGETWARDPRLEVECPDCWQKVGSWCQRPSGHKAAEFHIAREQAAVDAGLMSVCSAVETPIGLDEIREHEFEQQLGLL